MASYRLERGLLIQKGERQLAFHRQIDAQTVQFEDVRTGSMQHFQIDRLVHDIAYGKWELRGEYGTDVMVSRGGSEPNKGSLVVLKLTEDQRRAMERRHFYVMKLRKMGVLKGQKNRIAESLPRLAETLGDPRPPSVPTVMRWMRTYERSGNQPHSLISGNASRLSVPRRSEDMTEYIRKMLRKFYFIRNGESLRSVHHRIVDSLEKRLGEARHLTDVKVSESTVRRLAQETSPYDRDRARMGPAYASAKWRHSTGGIYATRPMQRVEIDHTVLDLYVIHDSIGIPLGRPMVTMLIDAYSGYILAMHVSFEGGSVARIAQAIKFGLLPKSEMSKSLGLTNVWQAPGLFETLVMDNGLEFHSEHMRMMSMELCFDIEYCPVRKPWFKGTVERALLEMTRQLPIPGRPEKTKGIKDIVDPRAKACVTFSDLCLCLAKWAVDVYPFHINQRQLARPIDLLLDGLENMPPPLYANNIQSLDILGGISKRLKVSHGGIEMTYLPYRSPELADMAKDIAPSFHAQVKVNPDDLGAIWVQHPKSLDWIQVPALFQQYARGLSISQHNLIRKTIKARLTSEKKEQTFLKAMAELRDQWSASITSGKRTRQVQARQMAILEGMSSTKVFLPDMPVSEVSGEKILTAEDLVMPSEHEIPKFETLTLSEW